MTGEFGISKSNIDPRMGLAALLKAAGVGLGLGGEVILRASNSKVPHEDGDLERTGAVSVDGTRAAVSYRDVAYRGQAVDQHENMTYRHDDGRQAKYLESAMNERKAEAFEAIAGAMRRATGG